MCSTTSPESTRSGRPAWRFRASTSGWAQIFPLGGAEGPRSDGDEEARTRARKPHTEWNHLKITSQDGVIGAKLNGVFIGQSGPYPVRPGADRPAVGRSAGAFPQYRDPGVVRLVWNAPVSPCMIRTVVWGEGRARGQSGASQRVQVGFLRGWPPAPPPHRPDGIAWERGRPARLLSL